MNQTFSSARFGRLVQKYLRDHGRELIIQAIALLIVMAVVLPAFCYKGPPESVQRSRAVGFLIMYMIVCPLFIVHVATVYNKKEQAISAFMLPASLFEKWLLIWLISGVGFALCFLGFFHLIDLFGTYYVNHREWPAETLAFFRQNEQPLTITLFSLKNLLTFPIWAVWALLHPFALMCALLFQRNTLVIGVLLGFGVFLVVFLGNQSLAKIILGGQHTIANDFPFTGFRVMKGMNYAEGRTLTLPQPVSDIIRWSTGIAAFGLLYAIAYFRLKEREV